MPIYGAETYVPGAGDGQPGNLTLQIAPDVLSVPAGLEAVLEYNGLFMNVLQNRDRYKITGIDGLGDADIRDTRDVNTDEDGETPYNSLYGGRSITITGQIQTYSVPKLRAMQSALRWAFSDLTTEKPLRFRLGDFTKDHFINCKKIGSIAMGEQQQNLMVTRDFQISLRASNPRFLSYYQNFVDLTPPNTPPDMDPEQIAVLHNRGTYWAQPIYRFYGPGDDIRIINGVTGATFKITGIINPGDYYEFNTAKKTLKNSGGLNMWNSLSDDSDYVLLQGGEEGCDNPIIYEGRCQRAQISWYDSWI